MRIINIKQIIFSFQIDQTHSLIFFYKTRLKESHRQTITVFENAPLADLKNFPAK